MVFAVAVLERAQATFALIADIFTSAGLRAKTAALPRGAEFEPPAIVCGTG